MNYGSAYFESQFRNSDCGKLSKNYDNLTPLGRQKNILPFVLSVVIFILMAICFGLAYKKPKDKKKSNKNKTIYKILFWLLLICFLPLTAYSIYIYFIYLEEYFKWYSSLGTDCENQLNAIYSVERAINNSININKN
tara:strand:+ start:109 stop:519 length:411 start_codon:yes stop_codon:yes gene_type:complete